MAEFNRYLTANTIVRDAMSILNLPLPVSASSSTESNAKQMWALLTQVGRELLDEYDWQIKTKTLTLTVQAPTLEYDFPEDLVQFVPDTGWNRTSRIPMIGPVTEQMWALLQARNLGSSTFALQFTVENDKIVFYYAPSDPQECTITYVSRGWVRDGTTPTTFRDYVENDDDTIMFDPRMVTTKLLLEWRKKKGFQTTDDQEAYDNALGNAKYKDKPRRALRTSGGVPGYPLLGYQNMPDTGYGS